MADRPKVLIVDEHPILRLGVRRILEEGGYQIIDEAADGSTAVDLAVKHVPDIALMEITLPKLDGMETTRRILNKTKEKVQVVILSAYSSEEYVLGGLAAGARGYMTKATEPRDMIEALRRVRHGDLYLSPDVSTPVVLRNLRHGRLDDPLAILTSRERQVLRLVSEGLTNKEVAATLGVAVKTVEAHRANLMRKLDLHDLSALIRFSMRVGLLSPTG